MSIGLSEVRPSEILTSLVADQRRRDGEKEREDNWKLSTIAMYLTAI